MTAGASTASTPDRPEFEVSVDGTALAPLEQQDVSEVDLHEEVGRHTRLTILVQNWDPDKRAVRHSDTALFQPGKAITLRLGYHSKLELLFDGVISELATHFSAGQSSMLVVEARSRSIQLAHPPRSRVLEDVNDGDVVSAIAADYSLTADTADGLDQDAVVIDDRSDWDYLTTRASELGWVTYTRGKTLVFRPPAKPASTLPTLAWGERALTELHLSQDISKVAEPFTATGWNPTSLEAEEGDADAAKANVSHGDRPAVDTALSDAGWPLREEAVVHATPLDLPELEEVALGRATTDALAHISGRGVAVGTTDLRADAWIAVTGVGTRMSGPHYVSATRHRLSARGYITEFQLGLPRPLRPPAPRAETTPALQIGIVEDLDDPLKWGRVKVATPWRKPGPEAVWARVATLDAGPKQGTWFIPDIGQEVVVATLGADDRHPVILGSLWNGKQEPPEQMDPKKNDIRAIVSRSGHKIRIDDGSDATVEIATAGGRTFTLADGDASVELVDDAGSIKISSAGVEITAGKGDITLKASGGKVIVDAGGIEAKATGPASLESSATLDVKASAKLTLSGAMVAIG